MGDKALNLGDFILEHDLQTEIVEPGAAMPTVDAAAAALGVSPGQIFKSILFQAKDGRCVMVIACGNGRVDLSRVQAITGFQGLRLAKPDVVFTKTGYPAGGTPPVGHREKFPVIVDSRAAAQEWGYAGGGRPELLVKIRSSDIIRLNSAVVEDVILDAAQKSPPAPPFSKGGNGDSSLPKGDGYPPMPKGAEIPLLLLERGEPHSPPFEKGG